MVYEDHSVQVQVTVYIPCHNYARFVEPAIRSVVHQTFVDWELIIVDDGSTDGSYEVIKKYVNDTRIRIVRNDDAMGLRGVANTCVDMARGEYVLRLDADDMLHPRCLELLVQAAKATQPADLVFSDFYYIDDVGEVLGVEILPSSETGEYDAQTFPPHGACSLIRRELLLRLGNYSEAFSHQDGHEVWLKLINASGRTRHMSLPLFFYRKHGSSLSSDLHSVLQDRARLKRELASQLSVPDRVVAVVPVKNTYPDMPGLPFRRYHGERLIDIAIKAAAEVPQISDIVVSADSSDVANYVSQLDRRLRVVERSPEIANPWVTMAQILREMRDMCSLSRDTVLCVLNANCPRRTSGHIQKGLDNFFLYKPDSVVSVYEEQSLVYQMGANGLRPINASYQYSLRREREVVYVDSGAVRVFRVENLQSQRYLGDRIGHALMTREDALQIRTADDLAMLDPYEHADEVLFEA